MSETHKRDISDGVTAFIDSELKDLFEDDAIKDIPVAGDFVKAIRAYSGVKEFFFLRKLRMFINESRRLGLVDRSDMAGRLSDLREQEKVGIKLFTILDQADDEDKAPICARIFRAYLLGDIDREALFRLWYALDKGYYGDFKHLEEYEEASIENQVVGQGLAMVGLLVDSGKKSGSPIQNDGVYYELSKWGKLFLTYRDPN